MKRKSLLMMAVVLFCFCFAFFARANGLGDLNGSGTTDAGDARAVLRIAVGLDELIEEQRLTADADHNGSIEAADARLILRVAVGLQDFEHAFDRADATTEILTEATCTEKGIERTYCVCGAYRDEELPALGHGAFSVFVEVTKEAQCTVSGIGVYRCERCEATVEKILPSLGHESSGEYEETVKATCTEEGEKVQRCLRCASVLDTLTVPAKGHSFMAPLTKELPTCTEPGLSTRRCTRCSFVEESEIPPTGHSFAEEKTVTTEPTCLEKGVRAYRCLHENCTTVSEAEEIPALGHSFGEWYVTLSPKCETEGERVRDCIRCEASEKETVPAAGHVYRVEVTPPTCTAGGFTTNTCLVCEKTMISDAVPALGHTWVLTASVSPRCLEKGSNSYRCSVCEAKKTEELPAVGHTVEAIPAVNASCTEGGFTAGEKCSVCGVILTEPAAVPAPGHSFGEWSVTKAADCLAEGEEERSCSRCLMKETHAVEKLPHTVVTDAAIAPTCSAAGATQGSHCSVCHTVIVEQTVLPMLPHTFGDWSYIVIPSDGEAGLERRECSVCGTTEDHETTCIHDYISAVTDPSCLEGGYTEYTCSSCGFSYVTDHRTALGHDYSVETGVTQATCTAGGFTEYRCVRCEATEIRDRTEKLGHDLSDWTETVSPSCIETGLLERACSRCDYTEQKVIPAAGHSYLTETVQPTCVSVGYTVRTCANCDLNENINYTAQTEHTFLDREALAPTCTQEGHTAYRECSFCHLKTGLETVPAKGHRFNGDYSFEPGKRSKLCADCKTVLGTEYAVALLTSGGKTSDVFDPEDAINNASAGDVITLTADITLKRAVTVKPGVMLLVPCRDGDTGYDEAGYNPDGTNASPSGGAVLYRTLTVPEDVTLTVRGTLLINAITGRVGSGARHNYDISGGYGKIVLNGKITVENGGLIDVSGIVEGDGTLILNDGATMYETYAVEHWRGGTFALFVMAADLSDKKGAFPITESSMNNMRAELVLYPGATLSGTVKVYASGAYSRCRFEQVGEKGLYRLGENAVLTRTVRYDETTAQYRDHYLFKGDVTLSESSITLNFMEDLTLEVSTNTKGYYDIDGDMDFTFTAGTVTVDSKLLYLPGAHVTVDKGAELFFTEKGKLAFLTAEQYACDGGYTNNRGDAYISVSKSGSIGNGVRTTDSIRLICVPGYGTTPDVLEINAVPDILTYAAGKELPEP